MSALILLMTDFTAEATASVPLICKTEAPGYSALLQIAKDQKTAQLRVRSEEGQKKVFTCDLEVFHLHEGPNDLSPGRTYDFTRKSCRPALTAKLERLILKEIHLAIRTRTGTPEGRLHWLRTSHPTGCLSKGLTPSEQHTNRKSEKPGKSEQGFQTPPSS